MDQTRYDLDLFVEINEEYSQSSAALAQVSATKQDDADHLAASARRIAQVDKDLHFSTGMRVLEVGCGRSHLGAMLKRDYGCEVVGLDIRTYPEWDDFLSDGLDLRIHDISQTSNDSLGTFDRIMALAVWEHMEHPYAALTAVKDLLRPGGDSLAYISANLYRGPKASHRYRDVFFPWPHLLFDDDVFVEFHKGRGRDNVEGCVGEQAHRRALRDVPPAAQFRSREAVDYGEANRRSVLPTVHRQAWAIPPLRSREGLYLHGPCAEAAKPNSQIYE